MCFVLDAAGSMDGNLFVEGSSFDDILMDLADQLNDTSTGEFLNTQQTRSHTHWFSSPLSRTTGMSQYQKGTANLDFTEARDSEWQWHQLGHMQVCTLLQTDNHAITSPLSFLQAGCPSCRPTNSVKALKALTLTSNNINLLVTDL